MRKCGQMRAGSVPTKAGDQSRLMKKRLTRVKNERLLVVVMALGITPPLRVNPDRE